MEHVSARDSASRQWNGESGPIRGRLLQIAQSVHGPSNNVRPSRPAAWLRQSAKDSYASDHAILMEARARYDADCLNPESSRDYFDALDSFKSCDQIERHGMPETWEQLDDGSNTEPCSWWRFADALDLQDETGEEVKPEPTPVRKQRGEAQKATGQGLLFAME